jgi:hypothetical protein
MKIDIDQLSDEIKKGLDEMTVSVVEQLNQFAKETADDTVQELKRTSPVGKRGRYAKGWACSERPGQSLGERHFAVHNKTDAFLTQLLEYGHIIKATGGRTRAIPHIKPAEEKAREELLGKVEGMKL